MPGPVRRGRHAKAPAFVARRLGAAMVAVLASCMLGAAPARAQTGISDIVTALEAESNAPAAPGETGSQPWAAPAPGTVGTIKAPVYARAPTGCTPPAPLAAPALAPAPPAPMHQRLIAIAEQAWRDWGRVEVWHFPDRREVLAPEGAIFEWSRAAFAPLAAYWCVGHGADYWRAAAALAQAAADPLAEIDGTISVPAYRALIATGLQPWGDRRAWSAVFIGWLMHRAGVPAEDFAPAPLHAAYVREAVARFRRLAAEDPAALASLAFWPHAIARYAPQPGDLVCASRTEPPLAAPDDLLRPEHEQAPMHCDLVVELRHDCDRALAPSGRCLAAIGGNVADTVARSFVRLDARGRLVRDASGARVPGESRDWFVILENRLDRRATAAPAAPPAPGIA